MCFINRELSLLNVQEWDCLLTIQQINTVIRPPVNQSYDAAQLGGPDVDMQVADRIHIHSGRQ